jgi:hypothetical protein
MELVDALITTTAPQIRAVITASHVSTTASFEQSPAKKITTHPSASYANARKIMMAPLAIILTIVQQIPVFVASVQILGVM